MGIFRKHHRRVGGGGGGGMGAQSQQTQASAGLLEKICDIFVRIKAMAMCICQPRAI